MAEHSNSNSDRGHGRTSQGGQRRDQRSSAPRTRPPHLSGQSSWSRPGSSGDGFRGARDEDRGSRSSQRSDRSDADRSRADRGSSQGGRPDRGQRPGDRSSRGERQDGRSSRGDREGERGDRRGSRSGPGGGGRDSGSHRRERDSGADRRRDRTDRDDRGRPGGRPEERRSSRPGQEARADRPFEPRIPEGVTGRELDKELREELRGLSKETADRVAQHLVAAYLLEDGDSELSQAHARFAARIGGRVGGVRETYGLLAYRAGDYRTAVRELRTSLRITGRTDVLPVIADAERGMGRPERALDLAASDDAAALGVDAAIELMIVVAGAYADTGDVETALRTLEVPALRHKVDGRWQVRLWVAYADLLDRAERSEEARRWLTLAADADSEGLTDAAERLGRPARAVQEDPTFEDDESVSVLDAYDPTSDEPFATGAAVPDEHDPAMPGAAGAAAEGRA
ncbi:MAG: hypothetical protein L0G94_09850 [Brachybacterium sp.]|uniref:hypothetical protein n=1 Tax=Brachybacterium sp. TaxID=1891286 RepID=UPI0026480A12|nr:hypothetical protein [Brachybacterium sp.]MDN5686956.1 hypothetical protein [Brachybacterium sp.]